MLSRDGQVSVRIAGMVSDSITDGPGLRMAIFVQGCDKRCPGCHNAHTLPQDGGTEYTLEQLIQKVEANPLITGVTLSGGEPLLQAAALLPLAEYIKDRGLELAIYTGDLFEEVLSRGGAPAELLKKADVVVDGPFVLEQKNLMLRFRGSANQRIIDVPRSLREEKTVPVQAPRWVGEE